MENEKNVYKQPKFPVWQAHLLTDTKHIFKLLFPYEIERHLQGTDIKNEENSLNHRYTIWDHQ